MTIRKYETSGTVDSSGNATAYTGVIRGKILAFQVKRPNACAVTVTSEDELVSQTVLDLSSASSNLTVYPRTPSQDNSNTDVTFDGSNEIYVPFTVFSRLKMAVSSGTTDDVIELTVIVQEV